MRDVKRDSPWLLPIVWVTECCPPKAWQAKVGRDSLDFHVCKDMGTCRRLWSLQGPMWSCCGPGTLGYQSPQFQQQRPGSWDQGVGPSESSPSPESPCWPRSLQTGTQKPLAPQGSPWTALQDGQRQAGSLLGLTPPGNGGHSGHSLPHCLNCKSSYLE